MPWTAAPGGHGMAGGDRAVHDGRQDSVEMEYKDTSRRGRWIIVLGLLLAIGAAAGAFALINTAQQQASQGSLKYTTAVVAAKPIVAGKVLAAEDLAVRTNIPLDPSNSDPKTVPTDPKVLIGHALAVSVSEGQIITTNMLATTTAGGQAIFNILDPGATITPTSDAWRAVSITVPDDHAVGGMLTAGMTVDVLMTMLIPAAPVPSAAPLAPGATPPPAPSANPSAPVYTAGMSTKVTYQKMVILARTGTFYVLRATLPVAEELTQAVTDGASFTLLLRPDQDARILDVSKLGATTSRILERYGLLIPQAYPLQGGFPSNPPIPAITPPPSPSETPSSGPSGAPSAAPSGG